MQFLTQVKLTSGVFSFLFVVPISYVSTTAIVAVSVELRDSYALTGRTPFCEMKLQLD
jgi:hypothetical protein